MNSCVFCKIAAKELPAHIVYEDDATVAFLTQGPTHPGHTLVIPKIHATSIYDLAPESHAPLMNTLQKVSSAIKEGAKAEGINIIMNNDAVAGQIIFHAHFHIIPRYANDGLVHWPHKEGYLAGVAERMTVAIREALARQR